MHRQKLKGETDHLYPQPTSFSAITRPGWCVANNGTKKEEEMTATWEFHVRWLRAAGHYKSSVTSCGQWQISWGLSLARLKQGAWDQRQCRAGSSYEMLSKRLSMWMYASPSVQLTKNRWSWASSFLNSITNVTFTDDGDYSQRHWSLSWLSLQLNN